MDLFAIESSDTAYRADFWVYGLAVVLIAALLLVAGPRGQGSALAASAGIGLLSWSLAEYALHRFVLHGVQPFERWHGEHHSRPTALIGTPTLMSAGLFATLVFAPAWALAGGWRAGAFTLGMLAGYLAYVVTHFADHHAAPSGLAGSRWLRQRRRWHARHHQRLGAPGCYGVTSGFWDRVFGSVCAPAPRVQPGVTP